MKLIEGIRRWRQYRRNVRILQSMSNRELADIGLMRGDIETRVRGRA